MSNLLLLARAEAELIKSDPVLGELIERQKPIVFPSNPRRKHDYFYSLCRSIVGQQISVKAAEAIFARLERATALVPDKVYRLKEDDLKVIGLSRQKAIYLQDLAKHFIDNPLIYQHLDKLTNQAVIADLIKIKGVGLWTAQMFLIFTLGRFDVFAPDDVGIKRAMNQIYGSNNRLTTQDIARISKRWQPYRTVALLHLWRSLQNTPN